jgi:uncharacterized protein (TIGR00661 family)
LNRTKGLKQQKRILVAPLDWGLGHATRCIPIIRELLNQGAVVVIGADKGPLKLLQQEFSGLEFITLPGYDISYPKSGNMAFKMLLQAPKIVQKIKAEQKLLDQLITKHALDGVISDNRFGLNSKRIPCAFITHQIYIQAPLLGQQLYRINKSYIDQFNECWIPDLEGELNLSGDLSHNKNMPDNTHYIGPLSRFSPSVTNAKNEYDVMAIVSGPEPQRSVFEALLLKQLQELNRTALLVRGLPNETAIPDSGNAKITIKNHLDAAEMQEAISKSEVLVCRPGYSSLMDLAALGKRAIFIPTPGQTEQEYLAQLHLQQGHFYFEDQKQFNLKTALEKSRNFNGVSLANTSQLLQEKISTYLNSL